MAKMTKAQAKKRMMEASQKVNAVFLSNMGDEAMTVQDYVAFNKMFRKCINRLK